MSILKPKCYKETDLSKLKKGAKGKGCLGDTDHTKLIEKDGRQCFDVFEKCKKQIRLPASANTSDHFHLTIPHVGNELI